MKKTIMLSLILLLCVGCMRIDNVENYSIIIDDIITSGTKKPNTTSMGYKYYLPLGVSKVYDKDYNQKLKMNDNDIYLYADIVSYYYRNSLNFNEQDDTSYYYQKLSNAEKIGYIKITETEKNSYFIKIVYNYAKIEAYSSKEDINDILTNSMIILDSIDYNDNLIEKLLENEYYSSVDKEYQIDKPEDSESRFSEYLSEYVQEDDNVAPELPEY